MCTKSGVIVKQMGLDIEIFPMRCKSWACPDCAKLRRRALIREAKKGNPNRFITLTVNPHWYDSPNERAAALTKAWRLVVAAYRHRWPEREAEYLCVFEATERGEPHLHIVWRGGWMPQKWLSAEMARRMGAPVVDIQRVRRRSKVPEYVTKYISKRNIKFGNCKRYWRSRHYLKKSNAQERKERNAGFTFYRSGMKFSNYLRALLTQGYKLLFEGPEVVYALITDWLDAPPLFERWQGITCKPVAA